MEPTVSEASISPPMGGRDSILAYAVAGVNSTRRIKVEGAR